MPRWLRPPVPVPRPARGWHRFLVLVLLVLSGMALVLVFLYWRAGAGWWSLAPVVPVVFFAVAVTGLTNPIRSSLGIVGCTTSAGSLVGESLIGLLVGLAVAGWLMTRLRLPSDARPETVVEADRMAVGDGAERFVGEFSDLGYVQVGAIQFQAAGSTIVASVLVGPRRDRYSVVTDSAFAITSRFGPRSVVSRNSAMTRLPPGFLDNVLRGGSPAELDAAHDRALPSVTRVGVPDAVEPSTLVETVMADERASLAWAQERGRKVIGSLSGRGVGPLGDDRRSEERIEMWLTQTRFGSER